MFKDSMQGVSNLSFGLLSSVKDMITKNTFEEIASSDIQFVNNNGDIYIPYSVNYDTFNSGDTKMPNFIPGGEGNNPFFENPQYFQDFKKNNLDPDITTINYNKSISLESLLQQLSESEEVYGVVIQAGSGRNAMSINPLHPMVAFLIMSGLMELPQEGKLHVFEYNSSGQAKANYGRNDSNHMDSYVKDYEKFFGMSSNIVRDPVKIRQSASIRDSSISSIIEDPFIENLKGINVDIRKEDRDSASLDKIKSLVVPAQLIMDGTVCPYYGISSITDPTTSSIRGRGLGPMVTGNISLDHYSGEKRYTDFYKTANTTNVCTGSESSSVPKGWFTLSKVNLDSMYYSDVIDTSHVWSFIEASKKISGEIWKVAADQNKADLESALEDTPEETEVA